MKFLSKIFITILFFSISLTSHCFCSEKGAIYGYVTRYRTDILLTNVEVSTTNAATHTNQIGYFVLNNLNPGLYDISFSKTNYRIKTISNIYVSTGESVEINAELYLTDGGVLKFENTFLPDGEVDDQYNEPVQVSGGAQPYTFSIRGLLPTGLTLDNYYGNISGTFTTPGHYDFIVCVTDAEGEYIESPFIINVTKKIVFETKNRLISAIKGDEYFTTIVAINGMMPLTYRVIRNSLPEGLQLSDEGNIEGVPTDDLGRYDFTIQVVDSNGNIADKSFNLNIVEPIEIFTEKIPDGIIGKPYTVQLCAIGGYGSYTWKNYSDQIISGLDIDKASGFFTGTPTQETYKTIVFSVVDADGHTDYKDYTICVSEQLQIVEANLPPALINVYYSEKVQTNGGIMPITFQTSDNLPDGLFLDSETGIISGIPQKTGRMNINLTITDRTEPVPQSVTQYIHISINNELNILTPKILPEIQKNIDIDKVNPVTLKAGGGLPPYHWLVVDGSIPNGLILDNDSGYVSGKPLVSGDIFFTINVTDAKDEYCQKQFMWHIIDELYIITDIIPDWAKNVNDSFTLRTKGGTQPYYWRISKGSLPDGLYLNGNTGVINGIPVNEQSAREISLEVHDSSIPVQTKEKNFIFSVISDDLFINTPKVENGIINREYLTSFKASLGTPPYQWRIKSGNLPTGLNLNVSNIDTFIDGAPTQEGLYPFTIEVTDSSINANTVSKSYTIQIFSEILIETEKLQDANIGMPYTTTLHCSGGLQPYAWRITKGRLPKGLTLDLSSGKIYGVPEENAKSTLFSIQVTESGEFNTSDEKEFVIYIPEDPSLFITTTSIQKGLKNHYIQIDLEGKGGFRPYNWQLWQGFLPEGVKLETINDIGTISGTPVQSGTFDFTIKLIDSSQKPKIAMCSYQLEIVNLSSDKDTTPPVPPSNIQSNPEIEEMSNGIIHISWNPGNDYDGSGVAGYSYKWSSIENDAPDNSVDTTQTFIDSAPLNNGMSHYFHICTIDNEGNASESISIGPFYVQVSPGRIIIIGGGEANQDNTYWSVTKKLTSYAYNIFKSSGFDDDMIYYMIHSERTDTDLNDSLDDFIDDTTPEVTDIISAIKNQFSSDLTADIPLYIYIQGHATPNKKIQLSGENSYLESTDIKNAIDSLQNDINCKVIIIIESCYSGNFIEDLVSENFPNRIIISSSGNDTYNTDSSGEISFSRYFFSKYKEGDSVKKSFDYAASCLEKIEYPSPRLIDSVDSLSSGILSTNTYLNGLLTWYKPQILSFTISDVNIFQSLLSVKMTQDNIGIEKVWIKTIFSEIENEDNLVFYPETKLNYNESVREYQCVSTNESIIGNKLIAMAKDTNGTYSDPVIRTVSNFVEDINNDNRIDIKDVITGLKILSYENINFSTERLSQFVIGEKKIGLDEIIHLMITISK